MKTYTIDMGMTVTKKLITPAYATEVVSRPAVQRGLSAGTVVSYADSMTNGEWCFDTGETVVFDVNGGLIQGLHRFHSLIKANISAEFWVIEGAPEKSFNYMDQGKSRTACDIFRLNGYPHSSLFSSFARRLIEFDKKTCTFKSLGKINNHSVLMFAEMRRDRMQKHLRAGYMAKKIITPSLMAAVSYLIHSIDEDLAASFIDGIVSGHEPPKGSPTGALRERLLHERRAVKTGFAFRDQMPYIIYAWNLHYEGRKHVRWSLPDHQRFKGAPTPDHKSYEDWV